MAACAKTIRRKDTGNNKRVKRVLHRPMIMNGGKGKKLKKCCVVNGI